MGEEILKILSLFFETKTKVTMSQKEVLTKLRSLYNWTQWDIIWTSA